MVIPKVKDEFEFNELLTYGEQAMIMTYKPKFNHVAARPTRKENLTSNYNKKTKPATINLVLNHNHNIILARG